MTNAAANTRPGAERERMHDIYRAGGGQRKWHRTLFTPIRSVRTPPAHAAQTLRAEARTLWREDLLLLVRTVEWLHSILRPAGRPIAVSLAHG
jgi:hypothetical protein